MSQAQRKPMNFLLYFVALLLFYALFKFADLIFAPPPEVAFTRFEGEIGARAVVFEAFGSGPVLVGESNGHARLSVDGVEAQVLGRAEHWFVNFYALEQGLLARMGDGESLLFEPDGAPRHDAWAEAGEYLGSLRFLPYEGEDMGRLVFFAPQDLPEIGPVGVLAQDGLCQPSGEIELVPGERRISVPGRLLYAEETRARTQADLGISPELETLPSSLLLTCPE